MVAPVDLIPDAEIVARRWALAIPEVAAMLDNGDGTHRCATRLPELPEFPFLVVQRIGGTLGVDTEAPIDEALMQFDAYAGKGNKSPDYATASALGRQIAHSALELGNVVVTDATVYGMELFSGPRRLDEPDLLWARYTVDMTMIYRRS